MCAMERFSTRRAILLVCIVLLNFGCDSGEQPPGFFPEVQDNTIQIALIDTSVVTPIGLAIDSQDDLYVLESHTHAPPHNYPGPSFDRIRKGVDRDKDGIPESWITFADSIEDGMNLAFDAEDNLFLTTKNAVFLYPNEDGKSTQRHQILRMVKPDNVYDHAGILGVAWSPDHWLYVSRGNTGSNGWRIEGTDGTYLEGYGDGGNVFRCRADGTQLSEVATGFWNPFGIHFTQEGRLLLTDNDPDSRGPNRLIEVVPGGNYGYQSLYGGSGIHPFLAWNGELPGTLPFAAALGEAPCGLIDANLTNFPSAYTNSMLVSVWEENKIVRVPMRPHQSTVRGEAEPFVQGDSTFHPVALAANSRGELYLTDWVVRQYPNHGRGRIWRLTSAEESASATLASHQEEALGSKPLWFADADPKYDMRRWMEDIRSSDPYRQTFARKQLGNTEAHRELLDFLRHQEDELRLHALLTLLETAQHIGDTQLIQLLHDKQEEVRRMALTYIAKQGRTSLMDKMQQALRDGYIDADLFETYLAAVRHLQPAFIGGLAEKKSKKAYDIPRELPENFIWSIVSDKSIAEEIRAIAVPYLASVDTHQASVVDMLKSSAGASLKTALLKALRGKKHEEVASAMLGLALDKKQSATVRAQALVLLNNQAPGYCQEILPLLEEVDESLQELATRYLCKCRTDQEVIASAEKLIGKIQRPEVTELWNLCGGGGEGQRATTNEDWTAAVNEQGVAEKGQWIFQSSRAQCQTCHRVDGYGGTFGPDLSKIGSSKSEKQLITAILEPSLEMSPEWQGWYVTTKEGQTHYGRQIDVAGSGESVELMNPSGEFVRYQEPRSYGVATTSLMPDGLENTLITSEFNHLIAYLKSLK